MIRAETVAHLDSLTAEKDGRLSRKLLDPVADFKMLPFFIVARILYGELPQNLKAELRRLASVREALFHHVVVGGLTRFRWARHLPLAANRDLEAFRSSWEAFNSSAYAHAKQMVASSRAMDPLPPIVSMWESVERSELTMAELSQTLDEALFANLDVTMGSVSWNIVFLAANPDVQRRLRREVMGGLPPEEETFIRPDPSPIPASTATTGPQPLLLSNTSLLAACILESARLRPLAAFSVPQSAPTPRTLDGYLIPAGTNYIVDAHALNSSPAFWGPDAGIYRPERFFEHGATALRYRYWRFGFGPRQCLGKHVADMIVRALLAALVSRFELGLVDEGREWERDKEMWISHPQMEVSCVPIKEFGR